MKNMSAPINTGGPAFPIAGDYTPNGDPIYRSDGMMLRDWFAGQALNGLLHSATYGAELRQIFDVSGSIADAGSERESPQDYTARLALSLADAMLAQREKNQ